MRQGLRRIEAGNKARDETGSERKKISETGNKTMRQEVRRELRRKVSLEVKQGMRFNVKK